MENRILKAKEIKRMFQIRKAYTDLAIKLGFGYAHDVDFTIGEIKFFQLSKLFNVKPVINKYDTSFADFEAEMYIEGVKLRCTYKSKDDNGYNDYYSEDCFKQYKEIFFEVEDREKSFVLLRDKLMDKYDKQTYKSKKKPVIFYLKNYAEFEHYLNRHKNRKDNYETIWSKYLLYKSKFEPLDTRYLTWKEAERLRPNEDYDYPMSFKDWYKFNS